jgi:hypothetical protein
MADERDPKLSQHYRSLEPLEPPAALDQKILAAAREAADSPHAPLVAPAGRHRWYYGLAAAAVLVFAVALTLHLEREKPDLEAIATVPGPTVQKGRIRIDEAKQPAEERAAKPAAPAPFVPDPATTSSDGLRLAERLEKPAPAAAPPSPRTDTRRAQEERTRAEQAAATAAATQAQADAASRARRVAGASEQPATARSMAAAPENPERWLERIAELRSRGRHADADRELAAFRKAYPNYQLSEVMRERVEGTVAPR